MIIKVPVASLATLPPEYAADLRRIAAVGNDGELMCDDGYLRMNDTKLREVVAKHRPEKLQGLGDLISAVTKRLGIPECGGCKQRRASLNQAVPFRPKV